MSNPQALESLETGLLLEAVFQRFGLDFRHFRSEVLRSRLNALLPAAGVRTLSALQEKVLHDPDGIGLFLKAMFRRSSLFADGGHMSALRAAMAPWLRSCPAPKVWIADCACPEDVYSLAILLEEEGVHDRTTLFATAPHDALLDTARQASFEAECLSEYEENYRLGGGARSLRDYCEQRDGKYVFADGLREKVVFAQYNLATDASFNEFELIYCPSSLDDFDDPLRHRVLQLFHDSLPLFGMLNAADAEGIAPFHAHYKAVSAQHGIYRRIA